MRTVKMLKPGQKGTKELLTRFGPSLLYIRYRYDEDRREHVKTVELVVQRRSREGEAECLGSRTAGARKPGARRPGWGHCGPAGGIADRLAGEDLQHWVKLAGGRGDPVRRVWMLRRDVAERLELMPRVVGGGG